MFSCSFNCKLNGPEFYVENLDKMKHILDKNVHKNKLKSFNQNSHNNCKINGKTTVILILHN